MTLEYCEFIDNLDRKERETIIEKVVRITISNLEKYGNIVSDRAEYVEALKITIENILFYNNKEKIAVIDMPTGTGKSTALINTISYLHDDSLSEIKNIDIIKGTIVLRLRIKDCDETAKEINEKVGKEVAYAYHSGLNDKGEKKNSLYQTELKKYPVLVLTHEGLMRLLNNDNESRIDSWQNDRGELFKRSRLVIDEEIANIKMDSVTYEDVLNIKEELVSDERRDLLELFSYFEEQLEEEFSEEYDQPNTLNFIKFNYDEEKHNKLFSYFKRKNNYEKIILFGKISSLLKNGGYLTKVGKQKKKIITYNKIEIGGNFCTIQLDATSKINQLYEIDDNFETIELPTIKTYSNTTIHIYNDFSGSKTNIENNIVQLMDSKNMKSFPSTLEYKNLMDSLIVDITKKTKYKEDVLVIFNNKKIEELFNRRLNSIDFDEFESETIVYGDIKKKIHTAHFGELTGRNDWNNCDTCFIIGLPFYSYEHYPLYNLALEGNPVEEESLGRYVKVTLSNSKGAKRYKNEQFEKIRLGLVASVVVQAINRIKCRKVNEKGDTPKTDIYIINTDEELYELFEIAMPLVNIQKDWILSYHPDIEKKKDINKKCKEEELIEFLEELLKNREKIERFRSIGGIDDKGIKVGILKKQIKGLSNADTWKSTINSYGFKQFLNDNNMELKRTHIRF